MLQHGIFHIIIFSIRLLYFSIGPTWARSYGISIHIYLCNKCLSQLIGRSSISVHGDVYSLQHYVIKFASDVYVRSVFSSVYSGFFQQ